MRNGGTAGLRVDITQQKQTETRLRQAMTTLDRVQRVAGIGFIEVSMATGCVAWSPGLYEIFGASSEDVEPTLDYILGFIHPQDREAVDRAIAEAEATGVPAPPMEYRIVRPDGTERILYRENDVQCDAAGRAISRIVTFKDITALKTAEARLREMMDNLDRAQRLAHMGSYTRDMRGGGQWSAEVYRIFGVDPQSF